MTRELTRRRLVTGAAAALFAAPGLRSLLAGEVRGFKIGACDWSLGKGRRSAALEVAGQIGLDGVEVAFAEDPENNLRSEQVRQQYMAEAKRSNGEICSLSMGDLNRIPYSSDPRAETWVAESRRNMR